jgi:hypothetical protein
VQIANNFSISPVTRSYREKPVRIELVFARVWVPIWVIAVMATMLIRQAMKQYSRDVAPSSSIRKALQAQKSRSTVGVRLSKAAISPLW